MMVAFPSHDGMRKVRTEAIADTEIATVNK